MNRVERALGFTSDQYGQWVAIHEAGHAVSALAVGRKVRGIELRRDRSGDITDAVTMTAPSRDLRVMPVYHAGIEAQEIWMQQMRLWTPNRMHIVRSSSRHDLDVIDRITPDKDVQRANADAARQHVASGWGFVQRVAAALLERGRLTARDLRRI